MIRLLRLSSGVAEPPEKGEVPALEPRTMRVTSFHGGV